MPSWGILAELPCLASGRLRVQPELGSLLLSSFSGVSPGKEKGGKKEKILKSWLSWGCALCLPCEHVSLSSTRDVNFSKQKKEGRGNQLLSTPGTPSPPERGDVPWLGTALPPRAPSPEPPAAAGTERCSRGSPLPRGCHPPAPRQPGTTPCAGGPRAPIRFSQDQCNSGSGNGVVLTHSSTLQRVCNATSMSSKTDAATEIISSRKRSSSAPRLRQLRPPAFKVPSSSLLITCTPVFSRVPGLPVCTELCRDTGAGRDC